MNLTLHQLIPLPLKNTRADKPSNLWKQKLAFGKGDLIFIQAPSGTGKTTLIHILYGLRNDYEGEVFWADEELRSKSEEEQAHLRSEAISIVFQDLRLFPEMTVLENLEIKRTLSPKTSSERAADMLHRLGMSEKKNALAKTLSYGEQQRVAIVRALLQPFSWLLMDEPFSHLDNKNIEKAVALIQEIVTENSAGLILADLENNDYFPYRQKLRL